MSLDSDLRHYRIENNRMYHAYRTSGLLIHVNGQKDLLMLSGDGEYWAPHDDEALRLDIYA